MSIRCEVFGDVCWTVSAEFVLFELCQVFQEAFMKVCLCFSSADIEGQRCTPGAVNKVG